MDAKSSSIQGSNSDIILKEEPLFEFNYKNSLIKTDSINVNFSVLSSSQENLFEEVNIAKESGIDRIHLDFIDGNFTPGLKPFDCTKQISKLKDIDIPLDVHLMVDNPSIYLIKSLIKAGLKKNRDRVFFHLESFSKIEKLIALTNYISNNHLSPGLVINPETEINLLNFPLKLLKNCLNSIIIMTIIPGAGSRPFIEESIRKVKHIKKLLFSLDVEDKISIISDGGLNEFTLKTIIESGVNEVVTRTFLLKDSNFNEKVKLIKEIHKKYFELSKLIEMMKDWNFGSVKYLIDAIVLFCKRDNTFTSEEIIKSLKRLEGVIDIKISDERVIDVIYYDKLLRFHNQEVIPIEHLGLKDRVCYDSVYIKIYTGNVLNETKGEYVLGISGSWHDSTAALIKGGKIIAALEEERMTRIKHDISLFPINAIKRLLEYQKIGWDDIKHISLGWNFNLYVDTPHSINPNDEFFENMDINYSKKKGIKKEEVIRRKCKERNKKRFSENNVYNFINVMKEYYNSNYEPKVSFIRHSKSHVASAYYLSGFEGKVLTIALDGYGDYETGSVWIGNEGNLKELTRFELPNSLGWVYATITEYLGFKPIFDEGKVMGFAPYGEPWNSTEMQLVNQLHELFNEFIRFDYKTQKLVANPDFFYYGEILEGRNRITKLLQEKLSVLGILPSKKDINEINPYDSGDRIYANLAFALQERTSQVVQDIVRFYLRENPETNDIKKVALAGGVALNILANGKLISDRIIYGENLFIQPAAGDSGTAIGSALVVSKEIYHEDVCSEMDNAYYGSDYNNDQIKAVFDNFLLKENIDYKKVSDNELINNACECIRNSEPIAWFQGRGEVGPRALGNRSILLNINDVLSNNTANIIKGRQFWRPSALSIIEEHAPDYFRGIKKSSFMIISFPILFGKQKIVLSGLHEFGDKLSRPQTVNAKQNLLFYKLLKKLDKVMGIPAVVNTSFNKQEPLVECPEEALNTFFYMKDVKKLFIGNFIVSKTFLPKIISLKDDIFDEEINEKIFEIILNKYPNCHKIILRLGNRKELHIPLFKEIFYSAINKELIEAIKFNIQDFLERNNSSEFSITCTNKKMEETIKQIISSIKLGELEKK